MSIKQQLKRVVDPVTHWIGRATGRYYFEDFIRVYPDQIAFNRFGLKRRMSRADINNYLNHRKFYQFVAQFVRDKTVADIGCGSGYGCAQLKESGAREVYGCDISKHALRFARERFGKLAEFSEQGITDLSAYADGSFDITISSEVLEHIKEYKLEGTALDELKRVTAAGGLIIVGTPNSELLGDHGFYFEEMDDLFRQRFTTYLIIENALVPFGEGKPMWERRISELRTGLVVSQNINFEETVLPPRVQAETKRGLNPGDYDFSGLNVDTRLLHNTHSWIVLAKV